MDDFVLKLSRVLARNPQLAFDFFTAASEIVDDLDDYRFTEPFDRDEESGEPTPLGRLRQARTEIIELWHRPEG